MKLSEHPEALRQSRVDYVNDRWKELSELQRDTGKSAATYLMVTNSGGAVAVLSFMGAMKTTTPFAFAPAMLVAFVLGIVLVGTGRAVAYYRVSARYTRWRRGVGRFFGDEWTWDQLIADDEAMGWNYPLGDILGWAAFACFLSGVGLSLFSLP